VIERRAVGDRHQRAQLGRQPRRLGRQAEHVDPGQPRPRPALHRDRHVDRGAAPIDGRRHLGREVAVAHVVAGDAPLILLHQEPAVGLAVIAGVGQPQPRHHPRRVVAVAAVQPHRADRPAGGRGRHRRAPHPTSASAATSAAWDRRARRGWRRRTS
jgi:hypothetical protein